MVQLGGAFETVADLLRDEAGLDELAVEFGRNVAVARRPELLRGKQCTGTVEHREINAVHRAEPHVLLDEQTGFVQASRGLFEPEMDEVLGFGSHGWDETARREQPQMSADEGGFAIASIHLRVSACICGFMLHIEVADVEGVFFDELAARSNFVAHQD